MYPRSIAAEDRHDVVERGAVDRGQELGIKLDQVVDRVKLENLSLGVAAHVHREAVEVPHVDGLPEFVRVALLVRRVAHNVAEDAHERVGECPVKVDVSEHGPRVLASHRHGGDAVVLVDAKAPLVCGAIHVDRRVVRAVDVGLEGVLDKVVI